MRASKRGVFITGTDTGVGKTLVAAGLLSALRANRIDAVPMKPVQTGCVGRGCGRQASDLMACLKAARLDVSPGELRQMCPYCFPIACSPHLAAQRAGVRIRLSVIQRAFKFLAQRHEFVVVEGAGGVLVPLGRSGTMLTIMATLDLPVVLVVRAGLGTLNHTLLTLKELRRAGLRLAGLVLNQTEQGPWGLIEQDNCRTLIRLGKVPVLARIRHDRTVAAAEPETFARFARRTFGRAARLLTA